MAARFLDGSAIPRRVKRLFDQRDDQRIEPDAETAVLEHRGIRHAVTLVNVSSAGSMVIFPPLPHIGERVQLEIFGRKPVSGFVRWARDGRIGVNFDSPLEDE